MSRQQLPLLLQQMETELRAAALWSAQPPAPDALSSTAPFCCDTLPLEQWLQFILIPRLNALLDGKLPLPTKVAIHPMAEHVYAERAQQLAALLSAIREIDLCLNQN